jgi:alpha-L-rhamnosidase
MKKANTTLFSIILLAGFLLNGNASAQNQGLQVHDLKVEYFENPVGIDDTNPRLSWKMNSEQRNTMQTAYRVQVSTDKDFTKPDITWDTGKVDADQSIHLHYTGDELESRQRYYWRVQVWDNHGQQSGWSETAFWEMGLLNPGDWQAEWIEPGFMEDSTKPQPSPMLRREFDLVGEIQSARAYVTGHGLYEMKINGQKVGDQVFTPGWTSYNERLQYQTYDVTELLQSGENAVVATLGDGWYRGYLAWGDARNHDGKTLRVLAQIEVTYEGGGTEIFGTDENWVSSTGPVLESDIYNGETYDARLVKEGWTETDYDDSDWSLVEVANHAKENLVAPEGPPVRKIQTLKPVDILETPEGDTVVDFGQNLVGWVQLTAEGPRGTEISLEHAEVLDVGLPFRQRFVEHVVSRAKDDAGEEGLPVAVAGERTRLPDQRVDHMAVVDRRVVDP